MSTAKASQERLNGATLKNGRHIIVEFDKDMIPNSFISGYAVEVRR